MNNLAFALKSEFKDTELGPLPGDWEVVKLREISLKMFSGGTPSTKVNDYWNGKIPWTTSAIIGENDLYLNSYQKTITQKGLQSSSSKIAPKGSVLIGTRVGVGKAVIANLDIAINQDLTAIIVNKNKINPEFLVYYLKQPSIQNWFEEHKRGATIKGISRKDLLMGAFFIRHNSLSSTKPWCCKNVGSLMTPLIEKLSLPLPPLPEQKAIARVLKTIQDAIEATEGVIAAAREFKKSLIRHLFTYGPVPVSERDRVRLKQTEIGPIPEDWEVVRLGNYFNVQSGGTPSRKIKEYWENTSIPWITSSQCQDCIVNQADQFITEAGLKNSSAKLVGPNVVLVAMVGATVGKTGFLTFKATTNQNVAAICPKENIKADGRFMFYNLQTRYHEFKKREKFSIANLTFIRNLKIPLPPLPIQQKIAQILKAVDDKIEAEEKKKETLQAFFKTMLYHLMTGKIRVKNTGESYGD